MIHIVEKTFYNHKEGACHVITACGYDSGPQPNAFNLEHGDEYDMDYFPNDKYCPECWGKHAHKLKPKKEAAK